MIKFEIINKRRIASIKVPTCVNIVLTNGDIVIKVPDRELKNFVDELKIAHALANKIGPLYKDVIEITDKHHDSYIEYTFWMKSFPITYKCDSIEDAISKLKELQQQ